MNALLFQYEICNVSRGLSETANCAHELFRGHSHCETLSQTTKILPLSEIVAAQHDRKYLNAKVSESLIFVIITIFPKARLLFT